MARICQELGDYDCAGRYFDETLSIRERSFGPEHPTYADALYNISNARHSLGQIDEAEAGTRRAMKSWSRVYGPRSERVAIGHLLLGVIANDREDYEAAIDHYETTEGIFREVLGATHPRVATPINNRANTMRKLERFDEALALHRQSLEIREAALQPEHPDIAYALVGVAEDLVSLGRPAEAVGLAERAVQLRRDNEAEPSLLAAACFVTAMALWDADEDRARALSLAHEARDLYAKSKVASTIPSTLEDWLAQREG